MPSVGSLFDPTVHEATIAASAGEGALIVTTEIRRGYTLHTDGTASVRHYVAVDHG